MTNNPSLLIRTLACAACAAISLSSFASAAQLGNTSSSPHDTPTLLRRNGLAFEETVTPGVLRSISARWSPASSTFVPFGSQSTPSPTVNVRVTGAPDGEDVQVQNDPSVAVYGRTVVVSYADERLAAEPASYPRDYTGYAVSFDGGATFDQRFLPAPPDGATYGASRTIAAPDGGFLMATLAGFSIAGAPVETVGVAAFRPASEGFGAPEPVAPELAGSGILIDSPAVAADAWAESPNRGAIYASFTRVMYDDPTSGYSVVYVASSDDGGKTFEEAVPVSLPNNREIAQFSTLAVTPDGELHVIYLAYGLRNCRADRITKDALRMATSTDGGRTFTKPLTIARFDRVTCVSGGSALYTPQGGGVRTFSAPSVAAGADGTLHVAFAAAPEMAGPDPSDVMYVDAKDGANFSAPVRVNRDFGATAQFEPSLALAADGSVGIGWLDRRNDPERGVLTDAYIAVARPGGAFREAVASDASWRFGEAQAARSDHGLFTSVAADTSGFFFAWTDERSGSGDVLAERVPTNGLPRPSGAVAARDALPRLVAGGSAEVPLDVVSDDDVGPILGVRATSADDRVRVTIDGPSGSDGAYALRVSASSDAAPGTAVVDVAVDVDGWSHTTPVRVALTDPSAPEPRTLVEGTGTARTFDGVVVDGFGIMHVCYTDDSSVWSDNVGRTNLLYASSRDGGANWSTPMRLVGARVRVNDVDAAVGPDGTIYATWTEYSDRSGRQWARYTVSTDGGRTFSKPRRLVEERGQVTPFSRVVVGTGGSASFVYTRTVQGREGSYAVAARKYLGGALLSEEVRLSREGENVDRRTLRAAAGPDAKTRVVYLGATGVSQPEMVCTTVDISLHGLVFGSVAPAKEHDSADHPEIAVDAKGHVYVSVLREYVDEDTKAPRRELEILRSTDGATFERVGAIPASPTCGAISALAFGSDGHLYATWTDATPSHMLAGSDCFFASSDDFGETFTDPIELSFRAGASSECALAVDGPRRYAVWTSDASGRLSTYLSELP